MKEKELMIIMENLCNKDSYTAELEECMGKIAGFVHSGEDEVRERIFSRFEDLLPWYQSGNSDCYGKLKTILICILSQRKSQYERSISLRKLDTLLEFYRRYRSASAALTNWLEENDDAESDLNNQVLELLNVDTDSCLQHQADFFSAAAKLTDSFSGIWIEKMQSVPVQGEPSLLGLPSSLEELSSRLTRLQEKVRREGMLSIEDDIEKFPPLPAALLQLTVDGNPPDLMESAMLRYFTHLERKLDEYAEIVINAALMIAQGTNTEFIKVYCRKPAMLNLFPLFAKDDWKETDDMKYLPDRGELNAIVGCLSAMADIVRRKGQLTLQQFPTEKLPSAFRNLPEIIMECGDDFELLGYLVGLIFSQLRNKLFHTEQITSNLIRALYRGESSKTTREIMTIISGKSENTADSSCKADAIANFVMQSEHPFQLLLLLQEYCIAATEFTGALKRLRSLTEDQALAEELTAQIEQKGSTFPGLLRNRQRMLKSFEEKEGAARRRIEATIDRYKHESEKREAEKSPTPENIRFIADPEQLEQLTYILLQSYVERQREQERMLAETQGVGRERIQAAARKLFGREFSSLDLNSDDVEIMLAQKIFPHGRTAMMEMIRNRFGEETQDLLLSKTFGFNYIILFLDNPSVQKLMRAISSEELALALKGANEDVAETFYRNCSLRFQSILQEEMAYMGPVSYSSIQSAQDHILEILVKLEEQGEVSINDSKR